MKAFQKLPGGVQQTVFIIGANFLISLFFYTLLTTESGVYSNVPLSADALATLSRLSGSQDQPTAPALAPAPSPSPVAAAPAPAPVASNSKAAVSTASPKRRNAMVGMSKGIHFSNVYRFVRSLRTHSDCDIILFMPVEEFNDEFRNLFSTFRVQVQGFSINDFPPAVKKFHPSSYRWMLMRDYLKSLPADKQYDRLFFADVRDAVFQRDPFTTIAPDEQGFFAFLEAKPRTISECGWNSGWVKDCFGQQGLDEVGRQIISCSGTSMATWEAGIKYLDVMADEIANNPCERNGVDQGMHNVFVHSPSRLAPHKVHLHTNEEGLVTTVQSMKEIPRDRFARVINQKKEVVAVVHQYDRSDILKRQYDMEYLYLQQHETTIAK